ncbi:Gfo/Idh/MocA family protein [Albidovulum sp.]|uniref:Gfo/Idh/MocA family protein n=1 Tax=Albidovulum sp. TaxID=1872424 RepID=UPI0039B8B296
MTELRFGVIGAGYMGKAYAIALAEVATVYELGSGTGLGIGKEMIATSGAAGAAGHAARLGFARSTGDWRALVADPAIDVVAIATPTPFHMEMALAALAAGKHVLCEKPLAATAGDAARMAQAAAQAAAGSGLRTMVGFNYIQTPATQLAREMVAGGELGEIIRFSGTHTEDFLMDPEAPHSWRLVAAQVGRAGAMGDVASHLVNLAQFLCGPIETVVADAQVVHRARPGPAGPRPVENDDQGNMLCRFASGVMGNLHGSRVQAGRKMGLTYEVTGTKGAVFFDQERPGELHYYDARDRAGRRGFRRLLTEPGHGDYGRFCPGAGHGYGYNDMIVSEMAALIRAIDTGGPLWPDFAAGFDAACVIDAMLRSVDERRWVAVAEIREGLE